MKNRVFNYLAILCGILVFALSSCSKNDEPDPVAEPKCTVLVYMIADNSLGSYSANVDSRNLKQMQEAVAAGALNGGRLLVYYDPYEADVEPKLLEITPKETLTLKTYSEGGSSVDADFMRGVLDDAASIAPAPKNWLVLWSHGTGWVESSDSRSIGSQASTTSFGQDIHPVRTEMKVTSLASALGKGNYDVIYFDCCFMGCVEVMYELRHAAKEIVASATELPIEGMPYNVNIPAMFADNATAQKVAENTLAYYKSGEASNNSCTIAVVKTSGLEALADATRAIMRTGVLPSESYCSYDAVPFYRRNGAKSYTYDFGDYINNLEVDNKGLIDTWNNAYKKAVTYYGSTPVSYGLDMSKFTGIGTYIVRTKSDVSLLGYANQGWYKDVVSVNPSLQ